MRLLIIFIIAQVSVFVTISAFTERQFADSMRYSLQAISFRFITKSAKDFCFDQNLVLWMRAALDKPSNYIPLIKKTASDDFIDLDSLPFPLAPAEIYRLDDESTTLMEKEDPSKIFREEPDNRMLDFFQFQEAVGYVIQVHGTFFTFLLSNQVTPNVMFSNLFKRGITLSTVVQLMSKISISLLGDLRIKVLAEETSRVVALVKYVIMSQISKSCLSSKFKNFKHTHESSIVDAVLFLHDKDVLMRLEDIFIKRMGGVLAQKFHECDNVIIGKIMSNSSTVYEERWLLGVGYQKNQVNLVDKLNLPIIPEFVTYKHSRGKVCLFLSAKVQENYKSTSKESHSSNKSRVMSEMMPLIKLSTSPKTIISTCLLIDKDMLQTIFFEETLKVNFYDQPDNLIQMVSEERVKQVLKKFGEYMVGMNNFANTNRPEKRQQLGILKLLQMQRNSET